MNYRQILAIVRYEILIQWRRKLPVFLVPVLVAFIGLPLMDTGGAPGISPDALADSLASTIVTMTTLFSLIFAVMTAETIPRDRISGMDQLLEATPVTAATYLAGKVISVWITFGGGLFVVVLLSGGWFQLMLGPFTIATYLGAVLAGAMPITLTMTSLSVMICAGQPNRRRAMLIAIIFTCAYLSLPIFLVTGNSSDVLYAGMSVIFIHYAMLGVTNGFAAGVELYSATDVLLATTMLLAQIALVGVLAWAWLRRRDAWR